MRSFLTAFRMEYPYLSSSCLLGSLGGSNETKHYALARLIFPHITNLHTKKWHVDNTCGSVDAHASIAPLHHCTTKDG